MVNKITKNLRIAGVWAGVWISELPAMIQQDTTFLCTLSFIYEITYLLTCCYNSNWDTLLKIRVIYRICILPYFSTDACFLLRSKLGNHWHTHWLPSDRAAYGSAGAQDNMSAELFAIGCGMDPGLDGTECWSTVCWTTPGGGGWR